MVFIGIDQSLTSTGVTIIRNKNIELMTTIETSPDFFKFYSLNHPHFTDTKAYKVGLVDDKMKCTKKKKDLTEKEKEILKVSEQKRIGYICDRIDDIVLKYINEDIIVAIEDISFGGTGRISTLARLLGAIERTLQILSVPHILIKPTTVKKFAFKGNASKDDMYQALPQEIKDMISYIGFKKVDDVVDSYWIAKYLEEYYEKSSDV